jgi:hypothetical protein
MQHGVQTMVILTMATLGFCGQRCEPGCNCERSIYKYSRRLNKIELEFSSEGSEHNIGSREEPRADGRYELESTRLFYLLLFFILFLCFHLLRLPMEKDTPAPSTIVDTLL